MCKHNMEVCLHKCVSVALVIQHARCMHHIILSPISCLGLPYIFTLPHKWHDLKKVCFYFLYIFSLKHSSL
jgi:hypothetical protein